MAPTAGSSRILPAGQPSGTPSHPASESKLPLETPFPGKEVSACPNHRPKQPRFISPRLISSRRGRGSRVYASERFSRDGSPPVLPSFFLLFLSIILLY